MSTALVLAADGRRNDGRWRRGSVDISKSVNTESDWRKLLAYSGVILDYAPDLAAQVVSGGLALDNAYRQACEARDAERHVLRARAKEFACWPLSGSRSILISAAAPV